MDGEIIAAVVWLTVAIVAYAVVPGLMGLLAAAVTDSLGWTTFGVIVGSVLGTVLAILAVVQVITHIVLAVQIGTT